MHSSTCSSVSETFLADLILYQDPAIAAMTDVVVKIIVELISTLALATKQVKQGRPSECVPLLNATQRN